MINQIKNETRARRQRSIRLRVVGSQERPRLSVYKSLKHIYAQVVDDTKGVTLAFASSLSPEVKAQAKSKAGGKREIAKRVGELVAKKCVGQNIEKVVFDRNGFAYHGRMASVADGARAAGLKF
jgi:large subunit ribosomal protein L18